MSTAAYSGREPSANLRLPRPRRSGSNLRVHGIDFLGAEQEHAPLLVHHHVAFVKVALARLGETRLSKVFAGLGNVSSDAHAPLMPRKFGKSLARGDLRLATAAAIHVGIAGVV